MSVLPDESDRVPPPSLHALEYSTQRRRFRARFVVVPGVILGIALALKLAWLNFSPQWLAATNQWTLNAAIPPSGTVIFSNDPALMTGLLGQPLYVLLGQINGCWPGISRVSPILERPDATHVRIQDGCSPVGVMAARGGPAVMVLLGYGIASGNPSMAYLPSYRVQMIASLWPGTRATELHYGYRELGLTSSVELTVYTAKIDPADSSHLTIGYKLNGHSGQIDGWLFRDNHMDFHIASGPATTLPGRWYVPARPSQP